MHACIHSFPLQYDNGRLGIEKERKEKRSGKRGKREREREEGEGKKKEDSNSSEIIHDGGCNRNRT